MLVDCSILLDRRTLFEWVFDTSTKENNSNLFVGAISHATVDKFIADHPKGAIKKLSIFSEGGELIASIRLGRWVKENNLDVEVNLLCMSGCANYVFPAGNKKTIGRNALVLWHGGAEQKDLRELQAKYERLISSNSSLDSSSSADEVRIFLAENKKKYLAIVEAREAQSKFFADIGVDEYITRLGQEPINYKIDAWTTTVRVMEKFGITNIEAAPDYGALQQMRKNPLTALLLRSEILTFDLDASGQVRRTEPSAK